MLLIGSYMLLWLVNDFVQASYPSKFGLVVQALKNDPEGLGF